MSQSPGKRMEYLHTTSGGTKPHQRPMAVGLDLGDLWSTGDVGVARKRSSVAVESISVIDDDQSVAKTTALLVESLGFRAAAFESAEAFLGSGQLRDTSCLIVDVQMPGMDGLELQSHLAAAGLRIPIIFMTAYYGREARRRAMRAGAVAFLEKPFTDEQLLRAIRSALAQTKGGMGTPR